VRLDEPDFRQTARGRGRFGLTGILSSALLVMFGFLLAVLGGVATGVVSLEQVAERLSGGVSTVDMAPAGTSPTVEATPVVAAPASDAPERRILHEETFGDWRYFCVEGAEGRAPVCTAMQQLRVAETGAAVFVWRIVQDGQGGLTGIWQVPPAVLLSAGLTLDAGGPMPLVIPFESCGAGSCQVVGTLAPDFIETLSNAQTLSASLMMMNRETVKFPLSPNGLSRALAALTR
jgi:invasion protein IalB